MNYCGANNNLTLVLDTLPSGRYRAVAFKINNRMFCLRSICVQVLNKLFTEQKLIFLVSFFRFIFYSPFSFHINRACADNDFIMESDKHIYIIGADMK